MAGGILKRVREREREREVGRAEREMRESERGRKKFRDISRDILCFRFIPDNCCRGMPRPRCGSDPDSETVKPAPSHVSHSQWADHLF